jgi:hypothetical protein
MRFSGRTRYSSSAPFQRQTAARVLLQELLVICHHRTGGPRRVPAGDVYLILGDELGTIFNDADLAGYANTLRAMLTETFPAELLATLTL